MRFLKFLCVVVLLIASLAGGAIVGALVGSIYAPVKLYAYITGGDPGDIEYEDDI